jgi:hypothetical protein
MAKCCKTRCAAPRAKHFFKTSAKTFPKIRSTHLHPLFGCQNTCVFSSHDTTLFSVSIGFLWYIAISFGVMTPGLGVVGGGVKTGGFALS